MCSQEVLSGAGLMLVPDEEYSEAGRGVYPDGLFQVLVAFYDRYRIRKPNLRYIITENGFADARDLIRRPYLLEHLLAVHAAIKQGVPVDGYLQWTISDNWEWADGYCPKFGLVDVDRGHNLTRVPRPSYYLYQQARLQCPHDIVLLSQPFQVISLVVEDFFGTLLSFY
jgi:beta-glucosidase/6-phospho-beta-glucosidase/beta-galactosidase